LIKLCKKYKIKLSAKKFKNKDYKHLSRTNEKFSDKNLTFLEMNEMDKNILKLFNYYQRDLEGLGEDKLKNWLDEDSKNTKIKFHTIKNEDLNLNLNDNKKIKFEILEKIQTLSNSKYGIKEYDNKQKRNKNKSIDRFSIIENINSNTDCKKNLEENIIINLSSSENEKPILIENNTNFGKFQTKNIIKGNYLALDQKDYFENKKTPNIKTDALFNNNITSNSINTHIKNHSLSLNNLNSFQEENSDEIFFSNNSSYNFSKMNLNSLNRKNENIASNLIQLDDIQTKNILFENKNLDFFAKKNQLN